MLFFPMKA